MSVSPLMKKAVIDIGPIAQFSTHNITGSELSCTISGNGAMKVTQVNVDKALLKVKGTGNLTFLKGSVKERLDAHVSKFGRIQFYGSASAATMTAKGNGILYTQTVTDQIESSVSDNAIIIAGNNPKVTEKLLAAGITQIVTQDQGNRF